MRSKTIRDILGIIGGLFLILSYIPGLEDKRIFVSISGIIIIAFYIKMYIEEEVMLKVNFLKKGLNSLKSNTNNKIHKQDIKISKMKGWIEAINFFHKGKKGNLDPVTLIAIIIIAIIIILYMQGKF